MNYKVKNKTLFKIYDYDWETPYQLFANDNIAYYNRKNEMKLDCMDKSFEMVFTKSLIMRITKLTSNTGEVASIIIDVHGLTCKEAKRFINNVVNITRASCIVEVIHGYRHGTRIKDMLWKSYYNPNIRQIVADQSNPGVTYLQPA